MNPRSSVEWSTRAHRDLDELADFLHRESPSAAQRAVAAIRRGTEQLGEFPHSGRPYPRDPQRYRELLVLFGRSGYVVLYRATAKEVRILAIRHMRQSGY